MSHRLIIQHPMLDEAAVKRFAALLGRAPARHSGLAATWEEFEPGPAASTRAAEDLAADLQVDLAVVPSHCRLTDFRLIAFDMDSTLITIECIDEIAAFAGRKAEVAAITAASMRGEIPDFEHSLRQRVALFAGLDADILERVYKERLQLSPGAEQLLAAARAAGLQILLVSGGFTYFTERLRTRLALDHAHANTLEIVDGKLTGRVCGAIIDAEAKRNIVLQTSAAVGCSPAQVIVVGDGANDLRMMAAAGVSVAYRAKPLVRANATYRVDYSGLDAIARLLAGPGAATPARAG